MSFSVETVSQPDLKLDGQVRILSEQERCLDRDGGDIHTGRHTGPVVPGVVTVDSEGLWKGPRPGGDTS